MATIRSTTMEIRGIIDTAKEQHERHDSGLGLEDLHAVLQEAKEEIKNNVVSIAPNFVSKPLHRTNSPRKSCIRTHKRSISLLPRSKARVKWLESIYEIREADYWINITWTDLGEVYRMVGPNHADMMNGIDKPESEIPEANRPDQNSIERARIIRGIRKLKNQPQVHKPIRKYGELPSDDPDQLTVFPTFEELSQDVDDSALMYPPKAPSLDSHNHLYPVRPILGTSSLYSNIINGPAAPESPPQVQIADMSMSKPRRTRLRKRQKGTGRNSPAESSLLWLLEQPRA